MRLFVMVLMVLSIPAVTQSANLDELVAPEGWRCKPAVALTKSTVSICNDPSNLNNIIFVAYEPVGKESIQERRDRELNLLALEKRCKGGFTSKIYDQQLQDDQQSISMEYFCSESSPGKSEYGLLKVVRDQKSILVVNCGHESTIFNVQAPPETIGGKLSAWKEIVGEIGF